MKEILGIVLFCGVVLAGVWYGPGWWRSHREHQSAALSITALQGASTGIAREGLQVAEPPKEVAAAPSNQGAAAASPGKSVDKAKVQVRVLNGGAAHGSAGKVVKTLQVAGFSLAKAGDSKGDYTGITVYSLDGHQDEAAVVKAGLGPDGASAQLTLAKDAKQETGSAPVVVVLGK